MVDGGRLLVNNTVDRRLHRVLSDLSPSIRAMLWSGEVGHLQRFADEIRGRKKRKKVKVIRWEKHEKHIVAIVEDEGDADAPQQQQEQQTKRPKKLDQIHQIHPLSEPCLYPHPPMTERNQRTEEEKKRPQAR